MFETAVEKGLAVAKCEAPWRGEKVMIKDTVVRNENKKHHSESTAVI